MKRNGPLLTLLAGVGVAAVLFLLSMQATRSGAPSGQAPAAVSGSRPAASAVPRADPLLRTEAPEEAAGVPENVDKEPLTAQVTPDGTWAGHLQPGTLALSIKDGQAIAYFCDGKRVEAWLKGPARDGKLNLTGKKGATLTGTVDQNHAAGKVTVGGRAWDFDIKAVSKPSGLYRAAADVRGAKLVGGWIVLADGSQVGLATVGGRLTAVSPVDVTSGRANVDGATVTAVPADPTK